MSANQRYKIKVNKKKPSDTEINQHKNFNRVLSQYNKRTAHKQPLHTHLYKVNKLLPVVFVMIFIIMIVFYYDTFKKLKATDPPAKIEQTDSSKVDESVPLLKEGVPKDSL